MKENVKRIVSGLLSAAVVLSSFLQPAAVLAVGQEPAAYEAEYPALEKVRDKLAGDEIVEAEDYEVEAGSGFDVEHDLSGLKFSLDKVNVTLHEAKDETGLEFDQNRAGVYKAVYFVKPVSENPSYHVSRKITVKNRAEESPRESIGEGAGENKVQKSPEDSGEGDGLTVESAMAQAEDQGIDLMSMEAGESISFYASADTSSKEKVTVTRGSCYKYADYGYGSYLTFKYTVKFDDISATAYCIQPSSDSPDSGTYSISKLKDMKALAKVCYYGTKASGDEGFFAEKYPDFSEGQRFILVHMAASHANGSSDAFSGSSEKGRKLAMELYDYCIDQPEIPDVDMEFSDDDVQAYQDGDTQRTKEITFKADELQKITMKLPDGVKFHNVTTGKTSKAGEDVEVAGGTRFYLSAPLTQTEDVAASWSSRMKGDITKDYSAYKITTGKSSQDLAFVFGEGVTDEKYIDFSVTWLQPAKVEVVKVDSKNQNVKLSGAVFGIYRDQDCTELIVQMPPTDENGASSVEIIKTQDTVYLKEITAPAGYNYNTAAYHISLKAGETVSAIVPD